MKTSEYLDQVKSRHALTSDYQLAKRLQVPTQTVSNWRSGTSNPNTFLCFRLAELLDLPAHQVVADIELERAERTGQAETAATWRTWLDKLSSTAAAILAAVILSAGGFPGNARADNGLQRGGGLDATNIGARKRRRRGAPAQVFAAMADTLSSCNREHKTC